MNARRISKVMTLAVLLWVAAGALAEANKKTVKLFDPATIGGIQLKAGEYSVAWDGEGPNVELKIMQGKKVLATAPAHAVDLKQAPDSDGTATKTNGDGSRAVSQVFFRGQTRAFEIGADASQTAAVDAKK
jgi:hypothetical protein